MEKPINLNFNDRANVQRKARNHFEQAEARTSLVKKMMDSERAATDAKTVKLRALRLAKEEADREEAALQPAPAKSTKKAEPSA